MKKILKYAFMAMLVMTMIMAIPSKSEASSSDVSVAKTGISYYDKYIMYCGETTYIQNTRFIALDGISDLTVTSSDTNICTTYVSYNKKKAQYKILLKYNNPGKVKINVSYNYNGTTYTSRARIKVVKYTNPLKSFKIGTKEYRKKFNAKKVSLTDTNAYGYFRAKGKKTIDVKFKKGYKMTDAYYIVRGTSKYKSNYNASKKVKLSKVGFYYFIYKDKQGYKGRVVWGNYN